MLSQVSVQDACLSCGACCAHFRVSFYWAEGIDIPEHYVEPLTAVYSCMQGTNQTQAYCSALEGKVGEQVSCSIYSMRSSTCREVQMADEQCNKARHAYQMIPLMQIDTAQLSHEDDFDQVS